MMVTFRSLWHYRDFIFGSVKREFQSKYRNSLLGAAWTVINPLAMIFVYTVIFSQIMQAKLPVANHGFAYGIYLCSGALTWGFFAEIAGRGQNMFLDNSNLIKKINFPRLSLPIIVVLNASVNFAIVFGLFLTFLLAVGLWPGMTVVSAIPVLLIQMIFAIGLGMTLGVINVFFRDAGQFFGIFLQFWFWLTPVVYPIDILPTYIQSLIAWNPLYPLIRAYQDIFVLAQGPAWISMIYPLGLGLVMCMLGLHLFRQHVGEMVDEL